MTLPETLLQRVQIGAGGREVRTVEGLANGPTLDPVQEGFMQCHGLQCGFCTPGMMMTARALLNKNPDPTEHEIREAISGQICRCTGYATIVRSVRWAAVKEQGDAAQLAESTESDSADVITTAGSNA